MKKNRHLTPMQRMNLAEREGQKLADQRKAKKWQNTPTERAALRIWNLVNERGQDALSHVDYQQIITEELAA